jgi:hypothetical protein
VERSDTHRLVASPEHADMTGNLVPRVRDWPYSSFHRMVKLGIYPEDWAGDVSDHSGDFGERR